MSDERKPLTPAEARSFDRFSVANTVAVESILACGCKAYVDVFTYNRWRAQGFQVQRGQKAILLPHVRTATRRRGRNPSGASFGARAYSAGVRWRSARGRARERPRGYVRSDSIFRSREIAERHPVHVRARTRMGYALPDLRL